VQNSAVATGMVGIGWMAFTKSKELKLAGIILLLLAFIVGLSQNYLRKTATA
jgi:predicted cobalt transporter CbtA